MNLTKRQNIYTFTVVYPDGYQESATIYASDIVEATVAIRHEHQNAIRVELESMRHD